MKVVKSKDPAATPSAAERRQKAAALAASLRKRQSPPKDASYWLKSAKENGKGGKGAKGGGKKVAGKPGAKPVSTGAGPANASCVKLELTAENLSLFNR